MFMKAKQENTGSAAQGASVATTALNPLKTCAGTTQVIPSRSENLPIRERLTMPEDGPGPLAMGTATEVKAPSSSKTPDSHTKKSSIHSRAWSATAKKTPSKSASITSKNMYLTGGKQPSPRWFSG